MEAIEQYDEQMIRCPRIGGPVNFKFCRSENNLLPCRWIAGCWHTRMAIEKFLKEHFSEGDLRKISAQPKPKIESLMELMGKAEKK